MAGDLLALAAKYVALTGEIEDVRRAMLMCLSNGADRNPPQPVRRASGGSHHPNAQRAAAIEGKILALLAERPMRTLEVAKATEAGTSTTVNRLNRMKARGEVVGGGNEGWSLAAPA